MLYSPNDLTYLTRREVANHLRVTTTTIDRLIAKGELESVLIGKRRIIPSNSMRQFIDKQLHEGGEAI